MGCPPIWQWPKSKWQGPLQKHQPQWWEKVGRALPCIILGVQHLCHMLFSCSALSGHGGAFPPDGPCYPLDVTSEPNALQPPPAPCDCSPQAQQQGLAGVTQCHRGDSRRDKELSKMLGAQHRAPTLHRWQWGSQGCSPGLTPALPSRGWAVTWRLQRTV